mmetsp:Transcript_18809/g.24223  ORF Transcript_18809/g.24223 Transcript_18809/m.24223 type:complete len:92 (+) Transcript_18809:161-436(+)
MSLLRHSENDIHIQASRSSDQPSMAVEVSSPFRNTSALLTTRQMLTHDHGAEEDIPPIDSIPSSDSLSVSYQRQLGTRRPLGDITAFLNYD